uniref:Protein-tyrosine-phosphatase n=1 Tax=Mesocestoides corti TaxID=53468 RepID=A0A5K3EI64_MESCO
MSVVLLLVFLFYFINIVTGETCSAGYFGEDCSLQCNCLDNSCKNTVDSPGCITGLCSPGYTGFPACQTQCKSGYFGLECAEKCSCTPENRCSPTNGNCIPPNRCTPDRIGPGCKILRSKLNTPPFLGVNCTSLVISWSLFNESIDSGASDVRKYRIELRSPNSEKFSELQMVPRENSTDGVFQVTVADVAPGDGYCVRIVPIFFLDTGGGDGYLADGIASPPSRKVSVAKEGRLTGPRNCVLIGLGRTWAVFKWDRALSACGLGDLTGYELRLSTAGGGGDNVVVKSYPSDAFTAVKVVEDLDEGTEYRVQIFATYERGSVACSDTSEEAFETYLEASGSSLLQLRVLERRHDRFVVRLLADSLIGPTRLWVGRCWGRVPLPSTSVYALLRLCLIQSKLPPNAISMTPCE